MNALLLREPDLPGDLGLRDDLLEPLEVVVYKRQFEGALTWLDDQGVIKVLGDGNLDKKLTIKVHRVSEKAREKIEAAGGTIDLLENKSADASA